MRGRRRSPSSRARDGRRGAASGPRGPRDRSRARRWWSRGRTRSNPHPKGAARRDGGRCRRRRARSSQSRLRPITPPSGGTSRRLPATVSSARGGRRSRCLFDRPAHAGGGAVDHRAGRARRPARARARGRQAVRQARLARWRAPGRDGPPGPGRRRVARAGPGCRIRRGRGARRCGRRSSGCEARIRLSRRACSSR